MRLFHIPFSFKSFIQVRYRMPYLICVLSGVFKRSATKISYSDVKGRTFKKLFLVVIFRIQYGRYISVMIVRRRFI